MIDWLASLSFFIMIISFIILGYCIGWIARGQHTIIQEQKRLKEHEQCTLEDSSLRLKQYVQDMKGKNEE